MNVSASYADSLADAGEVVTALAEALGLGIAGLVDAAHDAVRADDAVAAELDRATQQLGDGGFGRPAGPRGALTVPANPWELRADVRRWSSPRCGGSEIGSLMARRGDEIVDAARRATDGWDAAAAESYEQPPAPGAGQPRPVHRPGRPDLGLAASHQLDHHRHRQKELDQAWVNVAMVPHDVVGESRHLVFRPTEDDDRGKVTRGQAETDEIRRRLTLSLDQESTRLRSARAEFSWSAPSSRPSPEAPSPFRLGPGGRGVRRRARSLRPPPRCSARPSPA